MTPFSTIEREPATADMPARHAGVPAHDVVGQFCDLVEAKIADGATLPVDDALLRRALIAAVKAYSARIESDDLSGLPLEFGAVRPTEAVNAICALMRASDLNLVDMAMWFHRLSAGSSSGNAR